MITIRRMEPDELPRIAEIDRSEHQTVRYVSCGGKLEATQIDSDVPRWSLEGDGPWTVAGYVKSWRKYLDGGGVLLGAFDDETMAGVAIMRPNLTETQAQLAVLFISKPYRRHGVATRLVAQVCELARATGATELYVSATPSGSAVGFYRKQGFEPVVEPHPDLFALEPEDIHMVKPL